MSRKRSASPGQDADSPPTKRPQISESESGGEPESRAPRPRIDPTYGQRGAFPGLDEPESEEALFYGPAADGLEYLRMVRYVTRVCTSQGPRLSDVISIRNPVMC